MGITLANNATTTLAAAINGVDTNMTVADAGTFPALGSDDYFYCTIQSTSGTLEIVKVTAITGDVFSIVRGQEGTVAVSFSVGARVELRFTVQNFTDLLLTGSDITDTAFGVSWNGDTTGVPSRNALYDKFVADAAANAAAYQPLDADLTIWASLTPSAFFQTLVDDANASTARTTLGLVIGTDVQAYDAQLADVAGLTPTDNGVIIGNGTNFVVESGATLKTSLGLTIGTDVQAYDADLTTWAGLTPSAFFQTLVDDVDAAAFRTSIGVSASGTALQVANNLSDLNNASTARTNIGLAIGTDVQAYDADTAKLDVAQTWTAVQRFDYSGATILDNNATGHMLDLHLNGTRTGQVYSDATNFVLQNPAASNLLVIPWNGASTPSFTAASLHLAGVAVLTTATGAQLAGAAFTGTTGVANTQPQLYLSETDAAANNQFWSFTAAGGVLYFSTRDDVGTGGGDYLTISRSGTTATTINFTGTLQSGGNTVLTTATGAQLGAANTFVDGQVIGSGSGAASLRLNGASGSTQNIQFENAGTDVFIIGRQALAADTALDFYSASIAADMLRMLPNGDVQLYAAPTSLATNSAGFRGLGARNEQNANYTFVIGDAGTGVYHESGTHTYTIPPNSSVAFPTNTVIVIYKYEGTLSIDGGSGVSLYRWDGVAGTGTRTVSNYSLVTLIKIDTNVWIITGGFT